MTPDSRHIYETLFDTASSAAKKVSIILPHHSEQLTEARAGFLRKSIASCLSQTHENIELVIVLDGAASEAEAIAVEATADRRVKIVRNSGNHGLPAALNAGYAAAGGDYLTWTSDDNFYAPYAVATLATVLDTEPETDFVYSDFYYIDENDNIKAFETVAPPNRLHQGNCIGPCFLYRRQVYEEIGDFGGDGVVVAEDYHYWLRVAEKFTIRPLHAALYYYREHEESLTAKYRDVALETAARLAKQFGGDRKVIADGLGAESENPPAPANGGSPGPLTETLKVAAVGVRRKAQLLTRRDTMIKLFKNRVADKSRTPEHPRCVIFLMKNKCNSKCVMCGLNYAGNNNVTEIGLEDYKKMLGNLDMARVSEVTFSGGGDPFLCKDFSKIVSFTREQYPALTLSTYTNAIALNEPFADLLIDNGFSEVTISINAATRLTYLRIMGVDKYDQVIENSQRLIEKKAKAKAATNISLSFIASMLNIDELPAFVQLGADMGADVVKMDYCRFYSSKLNVDCTSGEPGLEREASLFYHQKHSDSMVREAMQVAKTAGIIFRHEPLFRDGFVAERCDWPRMGLLVGPEGEIFPCGGGEVLFHKAVAEKRLDFGNLLNQRISDFWTNDDYTNLRASSDYRTTNKSISQCDNCNSTYKWSGVQCEKSHFIDIDS